MRRKGVVLFLSIKHKGGRYRICAPINRIYAIKIAISENASVRVADKEIERAQYAKKGTYSALFPQVNGTGTFQRTIKKQVMYMDGMSGGSGMFASIFEPIITALEQNGIHVDMSALTGGGDDEGGSSSSSDGISVGRWNTFNGGISASMPLVNFQLWESLKISGQSVELAVEKARSSRLEAVTKVKQAYFSVLLAKEVFDVYKSVYENAMENLVQVQRKYDVQKVSELELTRAKANVASAIPNVYNAENSIMLALWQLKAVMGVNLDMNLDIVGKCLSAHPVSIVLLQHERNDKRLQVQPVQMDPLLLCRTKP